MTFELYSPKNEIRYDSNAVGVRVTDRLNRKKKARKVVTSRDITSNLFCVCKQFSPFSAAKDIYAFINCVVFSCPGDRHSF